jgi:hypothetical protein
VQPRTPPPEPVARVRNGDMTVAALDRDHSQQDGPARADPAADARADRPLRGRSGRRLPGRLTGHTQSSASTRSNLPVFAPDPFAHASAGRLTLLPAVPAPAVGATLVTEPPAAAPAPGATSGRMSIRQPVSFAASRAFWPSFPMASESW